MTQPDQDPRQTGAGMDPVDSYAGTKDPYARVEDPYARQSDSYTAQPAGHPAAAETGVTQPDEHDEAALRDMMAQNEYTPAMLGEGLGPDPERAFNELPYDERVARMEGQLRNQIHRSVQAGAGGGPEAVGDVDAFTDTVLGANRAFRRSYAEALRDGATEEEADRFAGGAVEASLTEAVRRGVPGADSLLDNPEPVTAPPAQDRIVTKFEPTTYGAPRSKLFGGLQAGQRAKQAEREIDERQARAPERGTEIPAAQGRADTARHTEEIPVGTRGGNEGGNGTQEATSTTRRQRVADGIRKVFRRRRPAAAGGNGGENTSPVPEQDPERRYKAAIERVARAKRTMESGVGREGADKKELEDAQAELRNVLDQKKEAEGWDDERAIQESLEAWDKIGDEQERLSPEEVQRRFPGIRNALSKIGKSKWVKYGVPAAIITAAVGIGVVTGGVGAGASAAIIGGAVKGGVIGGAIGGTVGGLSGAAEARERRAAANTKTDTRSRFNDQIAGIMTATEEARNTGDYDAFVEGADMGLYNAAHEVRRGNREDRMKTVGRGIGRSGVRGFFTGAAVGGALAFGLHGLTGGETVGAQSDGGTNDTPDGSPGPDPDSVPDYPPPPGEGDFPGGGEGNHQGGTPGAPESPLEGAENVEEGLRNVIDNDPSRINEVPGLEDRNFHEVTAESAAEQYPGENPWNSLKTGAELNNQQTLNAIVDGWSELRGTPGVEVNTWGEIQFNEAAGKFETTGDLWGGNVKVDNLYAVDANGDIYHFDGQLDNSQHAQLLDLMRQDGTELMNADQLAEHLAEDVDVNAAAKKAAESIPEDTREAVEAQADALTEELKADFAGDANITQDEVQNSLNSYIADHRGTFAELSDPELNEYLSRQVTQEAKATLGSQTPEWVNPAEVQKMLDEAWRAANVSVDLAPAGGRSAIN